MNNERVSKKEGIQLTGGVEKIDVRELPQHRPYFKAGSRPWSLSKVLENIISPLVPPDWVLKGDSKSKDQ